MKVKALTTKGKIVEGEIYQVVVNYHDTYELLTEGKYSASDFEIIPDKTDVVTVSPRQMRTALLMNGITTAVIESNTAKIKDNMQREAILIAWEYSLSFDRDNEYLLNIGKEMNMTDAQIDALFDLAATL